MIDIQKYFPTKADRKAKEMKKNAPALLESAKRRINMVMTQNPDLAFQMNLLKYGSLLNKPEKLKEKAKKKKRQTSAEAAGVSVGLGTRGSSGF